VEKAAIQFHAELMPPGHGFGDEVAPHDPGDRCRDQFGEKEPDMGAVA